MWQFMSPRKWGAGLKLGARAPAQNNCHYVLPSELIASHANKSVIILPLRVEILNSFK